MMNKRSGFLLMCAVAAMLMAGIACDGQAETIAIRKRGAQKSLINIAGLTVDESRFSAACRAVLTADLERSGWFTVSPPDTAAFAVVGNFGEMDGNVFGRCVVTDRTKDKVVLKESFRRPVNEFRKLAHELADAIVFAARGVPGIASSRIAMIGTLSEAKEIYVCDSDGHNMTRVTHDRSISVSPRWNPNGHEIVYTSFRTSFPYIYAIDVRTDPPKRTQLTKFPGLNMSAAISPDSREMALSLSKDGNPDLYRMRLGSTDLTRLTRTPNAAEASPSWSPDGKYLVFVSDTPGRPHLYICDRNGDSLRRITFEGSENVAPAWSAGGTIAYASRREGRYQICLIDPDSGEEICLTRDNADHEDPTWAPDGRHIAYVRTQNYRSDVYILDTMGDAEIRLTPDKGDWYSPSWSAR
ncbi:MAG: hypothetical protein E4H02_00010 [Lentisphaerales bacterium]|nr:MAG: hypothetical protein E4H02_00010 [Lentisphaerales bacterium]